MTDRQTLGAISGSREPGSSFTDPGPSGFDPARKVFGFIKDDDPNSPGRINVAIVQKCDGQYDGELIDFRSCQSREEASAYLALYGISPEPVWTRP